MRRGRQRICANEIFVNSDYKTAGVQSKAWHTKQESTSQSNLSLIAVLFLYLDDSQKSGKQSEQKAEQSTDAPRPPLSITGRRKKGETVQLRRL